MRARLAALAVASAACACTGRASQGAEATPERAPRPNLPTAVHPDRLELVEAKATQRAGIEGRIRVTVPEAGLPGNPVLKVMCGRTGGGTPLTATAGPFFPLAFLEVEPGDTAEPEFLAFSEATRPFADEPCEVQLWFWDEPNPDMPARCWCVSEGAIEDGPCESLAGSVPSDGETSQLLAARPDTNVFGDAGLSLVLSVVADPKADGTLEGTILCGPENSDRFSLAGPDTAWMVPGERRVVEVFAHVDTGAPACEVELHRELGTRDEPDQRPLGNWCSRSGTIAAGGCWGGR